MIYLIRLCIEILTKNYQSKKINNLCDFTKELSLSHISIFYVLSVMKNKMSEFCGIAFIIKFIFSYNIRFYMAIIHTGNFKMIMF